MTRFRSTLALVLALGAPAVFAAGCSDSHTVGGDSDGGTDSGILLPDGNFPDAFIPDVGPDTGPPPPMCGNSRLEPGEQCDDGNLMSGDGCSAMCAWEARCGDHRVDTGEVCDDGNNVSGDGCRSDCRSNETCGNSIVDLAVGEVCDPPGGACAMDCRSLTTCGNGMMDAGEQCDDGNTMPWDGCSRECLVERSMVLHNTAFAGTGMGCDYSGDGNPDNAFAHALGGGLSLLNMLFMGGGGGGGGPTILISFMGLHDATGTNEPDFRTAWLTGNFTDMNPMLEFSGMGHFTVGMGSLNPDLTPLTSLQSNIMMTHLRGGPEDLDLNLGFFPLTLHRAYLNGTTMATAGELNSLSGGQICGVVQPTTVAFVDQTLIESFGSMGGFMIRINPPCDGTDPMTHPSTMADWIVGGARIAIISISPTQPDVDLDYDGLESFELTGPTPGGPACQPVITACIDGDGTRVTGRDCYNDPRFQDGFTAALSTDAIRALITGVM